MSGIVPWFASPGEAIRGSCEKCRRESVDHPWMPRRRPYVRLPVIVVCLAAMGSAFASDCTRTSVGRTPLNDLGAGTYQGQQGGLYPGGSNLRPAAHDADLGRVGRVELLNAAGDPDAANGKIVFI